MIKCKFCDEVFADEIDCIKHAINEHPSDDRLFIGKSLERNATQVKEQ